MFLGKAYKKKSFNKLSERKSGTLNSGDFNTRPRNKFGASVRRTDAFTLIELLVVISIIALLSTIVLGAVNDAREKAQVKKKNEIARQYINALELYRNDNSGSYPATGTTNPPYTYTSNQTVCLGYENSESCFPSLSGNEDINVLLIEYYPSLPTNEDYEVLFGPYTTKGFQYRCDSSSTCYLSWYLPDDEECIYGISGNNTGYTLCSRDL